MKRKPKDRTERICELNQLSDILGVSFTQIELLDKALTHPSYAYQFGKDTIKHNQRLEFLGDAILDAIISEELFKRYSELSEGGLTQSRATMVCKESLAKHARMIGIGKYLLLGTGEEKIGGHDRASNLADAFEALIGAIYIDRGADTCRNFVLKYFSADIEAGNLGEDKRDYKSRLSILVQKRGQQIQFCLENETGPDHKKEYTMSVMIDNEKFGVGIGKSKKIAAQKASQEALQKLNEV